MGKTFDEIVKIINEADLSIEDIYKLNTIIVNKGKNMSQNLHSEFNVGDKVKLNSAAKGKTADKYKNVVGIITKIMQKNVLVDFNGGDVRCPLSLITKV